MAEDEHASDKCPEGKDGMNDAAKAAAEATTTAPTPSSFSAPSLGALVEDKVTEPKADGSASTASTSAEGAAEQDSPQRSEDPKSDSGAPTTQATGAAAEASTDADAPGEKATIASSLVSSAVGVAATAADPTTEVSSSAPDAAGGSSPPPAVEAVAEAVAEAAASAAPGVAAKSEDEIMEELMRQLAERDGGAAAEVATEPALAGMSLDDGLATWGNEGEKEEAQSSLETFGGATSSSSFSLSAGLGGSSDQLAKRPRTSLFAGSGGSRSLYGNFGGLAICGCLYQDLEELEPPSKASAQPSRAQVGSGVRPPFQLPGTSSPPRKFPAPSTAPNAAPAGCRPEFLADGSLDLSKYKRPSVVVLDLDDTCWLHHGLDANPKFQPPFYPCPTSGAVKDAFGQTVKVVPDLQTILLTLRNYDIAIAVASHNGRPTWCRQVMDCVQVDPDTTWGDLMKEELCVIQWEGAYWPLKKQHLEDIRGIVGCEFTDMVLFDDGKNIIFQAWDLGVVGVRCQSGGLTIARFLEAMSWVGFTQPRGANAGSNNGRQGFKRKF